MTPLNALRELTAVSFIDTAGRVILPDCGRKQLRAWWKAIGVQQVAEIGVWEGAFARTICEEVGAFVHAVDPWSPQPGYIERKNDAGRLDRALARTQEALKPFQHRIVRATSLDAAKTFADGSLDACYIDGNHLRDHVTADINAWLTKVKQGGVISGHDYNIDQGRKDFIQVADAVDAYTAKHNVPVWFVFAADKSPSWAWVVA